VAIAFNGHATSTSATPRHPAASSATSRRRGGAALAKRSAGRRLRDPREYGIGLETLTGQHGSRCGGSAANMLMTKGLFPLPAGHRGTATRNRHTPPRDGKNLRYSTYHVQRMERFHENVTARPAGTGATRCGGARFTSEWLRQLMRLIAACGDGGRGRLSGPPMGNRVPATVRQCPRRRAVHSRQLGGRLGTPPLSRASAAAKFHGCCGLASQPGDPRSTSVFR